MNPHLEKAWYRNHWSLFGGLSILVLAFMLANICLGSVSIPLTEVVKSFFNHSSADPVYAQITLDLRMPRALTAMLTGSALAVSGLLMQTVFRNPLADPFVLGVNSGASLGVAIVLLVLAPSGVMLTQGLGLSGHMLVVVAASLGSAAVLMVILLIANRMDVMSLLILGLMISYAVGAVVSILMFFSMAERLQSFFTWSFGEFGNVTWGQFQVMAPVLIVGQFSVVFMCKALDALLLGERYAHSMGANVKRTRIITLSMASVLTGTVTGFCGPIGFLGIAAPHLCRFFFRTSEHRILLPASILAGASIALAADLIAKAPGFETALPLNAVTALIGAPVIIVALIRQRNLKSLFGK